MPPPLDQFRTTPGATLNGSGALIASANANIELYKGYGVVPAHLFLSAQTELLIANGCNTLNLKSMSEAGVGATSAGVFDTTAAPSVTLTADNRGIDIARVAAHEMTHGIESVMKCQTEAKIATILGANEGDALELLKALSSSLPSGASQIREQFITQMKAAGGALAFGEIAKEIGAYTNESIYYELNDRGGVSHFLTRFSDIEKDNITEGSKARKAAITNRRNTAQEIIAVSVCDINTRIIDRLEARGTQPDMALATELRAVNNHLFPAYQRAEYKYNAHFTAPQLDSGAIRHRKVIEPQDHILPTTKGNIGIKDGDVTSKEHEADKLRRSLRRHSASGDARYAGSPKSGKALPEFH